ncbi:TIR domain-containing protein [Dyella sp. C9]|uniref:TIR domain-containing protein n=1 Tax=Dyella sp. C9 TaxID=2202154 RepID=UPI000DEF3024|nr:TIR domain-containing protein [Dyella sp. C9]
MTQASPEPAYRYRAFISYSHQDKAWADWLHKALETYVIPRRLVGRTTAAGITPRRLAPIFRDRDELASATDLSLRVNEALAQSANLIVICSPRSATSRWVNEEVLAYKRMGRSERVFCLIVDGEPNASHLGSRHAEECFAPALRYRLDASGRLGEAHTEPIAADVRPGKDGKTNAKLKLVAGLLDIGLDHLKQREQQRRQRRMAAITALAVVITAITTTLAVVALRAQRVAEHQRAQAEDLIGFMLGNLHTKLEAANRLDILDDVADKAMGYFSSLSGAEVTDDSLAERAKALQLIGRVREEQGKLPEARQAFEESMRLMQPLVARHPGNAEWRIALADSHSWLGNVAWDRSDLAEALSQFQQAAPLTETVVRQHPENLDWFKHLGWLHNNIGHVLEARGQLTQAQGQYAIVLGIYQQLAQRVPGNRRYHTEVAHAYDNLAGIHYALGDFAAAQDFAGKAMAQWQALARQDANDMSVQMYLAVASAMQAKVLQARGDTTDSTAAYEAALGIGKRLLAIDPTSTQSIGNVAVFSRGLAHLLRLGGDPARAGQLLHDAAQLYTQLVTKDPDEAAWQTGLAVSDLESGRLAWKLGSVATARNNAQAAQSLLATVRQKHLDSLAIPPLLAESHILLGELQAASGDTSAAAAQWQAAIGALEHTSIDTPDVGFAWLGARTEALCLLGRTAEAGPLINRLDALGYRDAQYLASIQDTPCQPLREATASANAMHPSRH